MKKHFFLIMVLLISLIIPSLAVSGPIITRQPANELPFVMTDDQWIGLGAAAGRIVFDDQATDTITFSDADVKIGARITFGGDTNADGIVFGSLGTATKGIDLSSSGLSGTDNLIYFGANDYWTAGGQLKVSSQLFLPTGTYYTPDKLQQNVAQYTFVNAANSMWSMFLNTNSAFTIGNSTAIGTWAGDGVSSAGTANITDVGGAAHGLSLAVGDLVHIQNCTTASHKGFYRIVTAGATTLVLDRVLAATDTDLTVTFYKDVIGFFATDGTNGQRITGYSHTDKPLQIGGDVLAATGHSLGGEDVLIGGKLEVDGNAYFDGTLFLAQNVGLSFANLDAAAALIYGSSADQNVLQLGTNRQIVVTTKSVSYAKDFDHSNPANPTIFLHSVIDPDVSNNQWGSFAHDQENFVITTGANTGAGSAPTTDENAIVFAPRGTEKSRISSAGLAHAPSTTTASPTVYANDAAIAVAYSVVRVAGNGAAVLLDVDPAIADGTADGQILYIQGCSDTNTVQIADACNTQLAGGVSVTLGLGDILTLLWDAGASVWRAVTVSYN